jgi:hypothetical protein
MGFTMGQHKHVRMLHVSYVVSPISILQIREIVGDEPSCHDGYDI